MYTRTHEFSYSAVDFKREGTPLLPTIVDALTCCSFGVVRDAGLVAPNVLTSGMSFVQSSSAVHARDTCELEHWRALDDLTISEGSGAAFLVTLHTHLPGDPSHAPSYG